MRPFNREIARQLTMRIPKVCSRRKDRSLFHGYFGAGRPSFLRDQSKRAHYNNKRAARFYFHLILLTARVVDCANLRRGRVELISEISCRPVCCSCRRSACAPDTRKTVSSASNVGYKTNTPGLAHCTLTFFLGLFAPCVSPVPKAGPVQCVQWNQSIVLPGRYCDLTLRPLFNVLRLNWCSLTALFLSDCS